MKDIATRIAIACLAGFPLLCGAQDLKLGFEEPGLTALPGEATIHTQFAAPDVVPGIAGHAWRTDGFSSWAEIPVELDPARGLTVSTWVAIESYPSDLEVPVSRLSPSSILQQRKGSKGFDIFIDTYGRWGLWLATSRGDIQLDAPERFPLGSWAYVSAVIEPGKGVTLYLDGAPVASASLRKGAQLQVAAAPLELARSHKEVGFLNFIFNRLNAAYDDVSITPRALTAEEVRAVFSAYGDVPDAAASLIVPESRFAGDHLRPRLHAMPPANWTNEPHGMVRFNGRWHLFYQRTPNGPYKTQMHWGHMVSDDLVSWDHLPDALWPELQDDKFGFDQKGIWSGDVIVDGDTAFAFYTSVNHFHRLTASNPGVAMAVSKDPNLETWRKIGPVANTEHVKDFRDPYLWKEDNTWHMIIGAALETGGGLDYYVLEPGKKGAKWEHRDKFTSVSYRLLDNGSIIWEMPVFEPLTEDVHVLVVNPIGGRVSKYGDPATRGVYWAGTWQDGVFTPFDREPKMLDVIPGHLSPTVERGDDGAWRAIGIVDERRSPQAQEDAGWAHTFSFPRRWHLMPDGRTLGQSPAPELTTLRGEVLAELDTLAVNATPQTLFGGAHAYELELSVADGLDGSMTLDILASPDREEFTRLEVDATRNTIVLDKSSSTTSTDGEGPDRVSGDYDASAFGPIETIRVFADGSVVDVFINEAAAFSFRAYPSRADSTSVQVAAPDGALSLSAIKAWRLQRPE